MSSSTKRPHRAGPSDPGNSIFNPAAWLEGAERCGYRIYLSGGPSGGRLCIVLESPGRRKATDDTALWHEFQGHPRHSRANRAALIAHLVSIGRFCQGDDRAELVPQAREADAKRPRPGPPRGRAQDRR